MTSILAAEGAVNPLIPHPIEIIMSLIVFGILFYVVRTWVAPRFEKAFAERAEAIEGGLKRAEETQAEAKAALERYQQQLSEARHEASRIREEAKEQGAAIVAEMREQAQAEAQRIVAHAHTQLEAERQQALLQLRSEIGDLSTQLAGRIVGEALEDEGRQRRIVERFIAELEQQPVGEAR
ncbi:F-type H+-transporting ATPase subunit b [Actinopolymorpha rutila]|uniref:ATP synthase subunit b n=1 Tax=Actinopolymorpha rutila TaxID=446787 RepID=A0A852Z713_9ACTN|nr:F0F1 ATP synthase subunit B [Actinopolymorpha rutila]NYH89067.1 F-type H+-transporting ATPase subunit b [Actinopolymorpha rutila]